MRKIILTERVWISFEAAYKTEPASFMLSGSEFGLREFILSTAPIRHQPRATLHVIFQQRPKEAYSYLALKLRSATEWQITSMNDDSGQPFVEIVVNHAMLEKLFDSIASQIGDSYCPSEMSLGSRRDKKQWRKNLLYIICDQIQTSDYKTWEWRTAD
jgi:hypothetical protein